MNYKSRGNYPVKLQCVNEDCVRIHTAYCVGCSESNSYSNYTTDPLIAEEINKCPKAKEIMGELKCVAYGTGSCLCCHSPLGYSNYTTELLDFEDYSG